ncbi:hypothetical protein GCM10010357_07720 [Streptomyces luteireticuli]|uniref:Uncharacterized protein n=1 Tax=Streptomyces luteireticuli TaxID=173858 RepID=A0ABP3I3D7_9ACTN
MVILWRFSPQGLGIGTWLPLRAGPMTKTLGPDPISHDHPHGLPDPDRADVWCFSRARMASGAGNSQWAPGGSWCVGVVGGSEALGAGDVSVGMGTLSRGGASPSG